MKLLNVISFIAFTVALTPLTSMAADEQTDVGQTDVIVQTVTDEQMSATQEQAVINDQAAPIQSEEAVVVDAQQAVVMGPEMITVAPQAAASDQEQSAVTSDASSAGEQFASVMSNDDLSEMRGGFVTDSVVNSNLVAVLGGNSAQNTVSGANNISENALTNVAGLTSIIQNSGNNVIIQSSTVVNVTMQ